MSKIRMNTEFRNKILNRYVDSAETENTQEREGYLDAREKVDALYTKAFELATLKMLLVPESFISFIIKYIILFLLFLIIFNLYLDNGIVKHYI